jgi:hypothetical protein
MEKYRNLYLWMIIPILIMQLGIFPFYWGDFIDNAWSIHVHYWVSTVWYLYLIIQPYLATHNKLGLHRTNGIIGMFIAGGTSFTAFSLFYRDLNLAYQNPDVPYVWFSYGVVVIEFTMMLAFTYAVVKSIVHRKEFEHHAWWLISTVFIIMMPAVFRGVLNMWSSMVEHDLSKVDWLVTTYITSFIIIALSLLAAWKYQKLKHPATFLIVAVNLFNCLVGVIGKNRAIQVSLEQIIKG